MGLGSINRANGTTDFYQWGLNCQFLKFTDAQCEDVLNQFNITNQDDRDMFWHAFVNCRPFAASDFDVAIYCTQGGGLAKWDEGAMRYKFVTAPNPGTFLATYDYVPEEWSVQPCNNKIKIDDRDAAKIHSDYMSKVDGGDIEDGYQDYL